MLNPKSISISSRRELEERDRMTSALSRDLGGRGGMACRSLWPGSLLLSLLFSHSFRQPPPFPPPCTFPTPPFRMPPSKPASSCSHPCHPSRDFHSSNSSCRSNLTPGPSPQMLTAFCVQTVRRCPAVDRDHLPGQCLSMFPKHCFPWGVTSLRLCGSDAGSS